MISITLPSIFPDALRRAHDNIVVTTVGSYELIVVADFERPSWASDRVVWIKEGERRGNPHAHFVAAQHARGEFITAMSDDCRYVYAWDVDSIANYEKRRASAGGKLCLGMHFGLIGTVFGIYYANFPFLRTADALSLGYFDSNYKKGFADSDLGLKVWSSGGRCEFTENKLVEITAEDERKGAEDCPAEDLQYFLEKWGVRYGKGFDTSHMRAINLDFDPKLYPELVAGFSVYRNSSAFVARVNMLSPPHLMETMENWNIVWFGGAAYAVPHSAGKVNLENTSDLAHVFDSGGASFETVGEARAFAVQENSRGSVGKRDRKGGGSFGPKVNFCHSVEAGVPLCQVSDSKISKRDVNKPRRKNLLTGTNIVVGNHLSHSGIGEIVYATHKFLSRCWTGCPPTVSSDVVPDKVNILIDEFSVPGSGLYLRKFKHEHPQTRVVIVATEFVSELKVLGRKLGRTFNYFDLWDDRRYVAAMAAHRLGIRKSMPYMRQRFIGFIEAIRAADFVIGIHPVITAAVNELANELGIDNWVAPSATLYPEVDPNIVAKDERLSERPTGFIVGGSLTPFRQKIVGNLIVCGKQAGIHVPFCARLPFDQSGAFWIKQGQLKFDFEADAYQKQSNVHFNGVRKTPYNDKSILNLGDAYIYNLNPPQRRAWSYSSPMRILRAVLAGQIPIVTKRFFDHEIEAIPLLWDGSVHSFCELWQSASIGRSQLIESHVARVRAYSSTAEGMNGPVAVGLKKLLESRSFE